MRDVSTELRVAVEVAVIPFIYNRFSGDLLQFFRDPVARVVSNFELR